MPYNPDTTPRGYQQGMSIGKETTWGDAVAATAQLLLIDKVPEPNNDVEMQPVLANASFPHPHQLLTMKKSHSISLDHRLYPSQAELLIQAGHYRDVTTKEMDSFTLRHGEGITSVGSIYAGCRCGSQTLSWENDGFITLAQEFIAKSRTAGVFSGTGLDFPAEEPFRGWDVTLEVNGVTANEVTAGKVAWNNNVKPGPITSGAIVSSLRSGFQDITGEFTAAFDTDAWQALVASRVGETSAYFDVTIVITGMDSNDQPVTITIVISDCKASGDGVAGSIDGTLMQSISTTSKSGIEITYA